MNKTNELNHEIGQLLMCGFHGTEATDGILDLIRNHNLGSVIFFSRNIESPKQVQHLTNTLQTAAKESGHKRPLLIAVDQENGVVRRLGLSGTYLPGSMALGAIGSTSAAYQVAAATSKELLALGINWNLAPDMDVNNNSLNPVIGVRSFGEDPESVGRLGVAQVEAYQKNRVATSIKHFPGHGDTATDSHLGVPVIDKDINELEEIELIPFRQAIAAKGDAYPTSVMIAHISLPKIINEKNRPASISSEIATDLLRNRLGYEGIIITDCVEMDAVKDTVGSGRGAVMALQAGNDMSMISHTLEFQQDAFKFLGEELTAGTMDEDALRRSLERVAALKDRFLTWEDALSIKDLGIVGCQEHVELSDRLYNKVPTLVRDRQALLPIQPKESQKILFLAAHVPLTLAIDSETEPFNSMYDSLRRRHSNTEYLIFKEDTKDLSSVIQEADYVIIGTANGNLHPFQSEVVKLATTLTKKLIVVAVINPYDLMSFPEIDTYLVTYEYTPPAHEAFVRMLFGEIKNDNHLPVTIPDTKDAVLSQSPYKIQKFTNDQLASAHQLWNTIYSTTWPLSFEHFSLILSRMEQPRHFAVFGENNTDIIGFAATQTIKDGNHGQLALLIVHPEHQGRGIGTLLNDHCLELFRKNGSSVMLGASYPRFFCGVPVDDKIGQKAQGFFKRRGYTFQDNIIWDLIGDLSEYEIPAALTARMEKEKIWFGTIDETKSEQLEELFAFQAKYFDYWLSTYKHHAELGDYHDLLVAREGDKDGKLVGSLVLYTNEGSHKYRTDLVWTHPSLFGAESGGMACVGVASEERGRGIGIGIVAYANKVLKERGVKKSYVDWVELVDFYSRTGYQTWRSYKLAAMK
jgi:beta-N-acetylhexosaminidase